MKPGVAFQRGLHPCRTKPRTSFHFSTRPTRFPFLPYSNYRIPLTLPDTTRELKDVANRIPRKPGRNRLRPGSSFPPPFFHVPLRREFFDFSLPLGVSLKDGWVFSLPGPQQPPAPIEQRPENPWFSSNTTKLDMFETKRFFAASSWRPSPATCAETALPRLGVGTESHLNEPHARLPRKVGGKKHSSHF